MRRTTAALGSMIFFVLAESSRDLFRWLTGWQVRQPLSVLGRDAAARSSEWH